MFRKLNLAIAAIMLLGAASAASAQEFDPNLANRYPAYAGPVSPAPHAMRINHEPNVSLRRNYAATHGQSYEFSVDQSDRASSPYQDF